MDETMIGLKTHLILSAAMLLVPTIAGANCGPFGVIGDNDYCVRCPGKQDSRQNSCPGGEVGRVAMGVANPGCQVTYFDGHCNGFTPQALIPAKNRQKESTFNPVKPGRAAVSQKGDIVTLRMTKADFDKLMSTPPSK